MRLGWPLGSVALAAALASFGTIVDSGDAQAAEAAAAPAGGAGGADAELTRIADGRSQKWNWEPPGTRERYGHAEVLVHAPFEAVRRQVLDFGHYKDLVPDKFHNARVVGKQGDATEVYMQVPIMHGMLTLWDVMRFRELRPTAPGWAMVEGWLVKGNVRAANAAWTVRKVDDEFTLLKFDLLILPNLPAPQSAIDEELRDAAMQAVDAIHDRAQGTHDPVPYPKR